MDHINHKIACSVKTCAHHAGSQGYCTLDSIEVGKCTSEAHSCANTECASFQDGCHCNKH